MPIQYSPSALSILTLLNNASELIVRCNKRKEAQDVMRAIELYAKSKRYTLPDNKIESFHSILIDARPNTLQDLIYSIAGDIITAENNKRKKTV